MRNLLLILIALSIFSCSPCKRLAIKEGKIHAKQNIHGCYVPPKTDTVKLYVKVTDTIIIRDTLLRVDTIVKIRTFRDTVVTKIYYKSNKAKIDTSFVAGRVSSSKAWITDNRLFHTLKENDSLFILREQYLREISKIKSSKAEVTKVVKNDFNFYMLIAIIILTFILIIVLRNRS